MNYETGNKLMPQTLSKMERNIFGSLIVLISIFSVLDFSVAVFAGENDNEPRLFGGLFGTIEFAGQSLFWEPGLSAVDELDRPLIDYDAEGLRSYEARAALGYGGSPAIVFSREAPFEATKSQQDMFAVNQIQTAGLEKFTGKLDIAPILDAAFPVLSEHPFWRAMLSLRITHAQSVFYGNARVSRAFYFLPLAADVDFGAGTVTGATKINVGSSLSFRTEFLDQEVSVRVWEMPAFDFPFLLNGKPNSVTVPPHILRLGYYQLQWDRPSDNNYEYYVLDAFGAYPIIYESNYVSKGLVVGFEDPDPSAHGFNFDVSVRGLGADNEIQAAIQRNLEDRTGIKRNLDFGSLKMAFRYNWYLNGAAKASGLFLNLGVDLETRFWEIVESDEEGNELSRQTIDRDNLTKIQVRAGYRF
ncbi:MAG: hypothetical protein HY547_09830 [Elusimicrobia bacterium]|nr:hypothetical protein [Elusimicrobiota bacterium]